MKTGLKYFIFLIVSWLTVVDLPAQTPGRISIHTDSVSSVKALPSLSPLQSALSKNIFVNNKAAAVSQYIQTRKPAGRNDFFYLLLFLVLLFGIAKAAYSKYFSNLFRVFFNTSLRQSQLTDQLVQDQLASLVFNIIFVVSVGLYFYFLMRYFHFTGDQVDWKLIILSVAGTAAVYFVKYSTLKFTGWITGFSHEAGTYTFIIFLINKIIGICLLPVIVVLAFSDPEIARIFVIISFVLLGLLLFMRFFRSYGLLQSKISVSRFHFFLYIFAVEILPLFVIYKAVLLYFSRNL